MTRPDSVRLSLSSIAIIQLVEEGEALWLAQWNPKWRAYHFVGGHRRPDETYCECVIREVAEELGLEPGRDFRVESGRPIHREFDAFSASAQQNTHYIMELFDVALTGEEARERVDQDPANRWLTVEEIRSGTTSDGRPVSPTMKRLLESWQREQERGVVN